MNKTDLMKSGYDNLDVLESLIDEYNVYLDDALKTRFTAESYVEIMREIELELATQAASMATNETGRKAALARLLIENPGYQRAKNAEKKFREDHQRLENNALVLKEKIRFRHAAIAFQTALLKG